MGSVLSIYANRDYLFTMGLLPATGALGVASLYMIDLEDYFVPENDPNEIRNRLSIRCASFTALLGSYVTYAYSLDHFLGNYFK